MLQHCPEVPIGCHKNPVKENISVPLQKTAAAVNELSGKNPPIGHNDWNMSASKHLVIASYHKFETWP